MNRVLRHHCQTICLLLLSLGCGPKNPNSLTQNADNWRPEGPHIKIVDAGPTVITRFLPHSHEQPAEPVDGKDRCVIERGAILPIQGPPINLGNFYLVNLRDFLDGCEFSRGYLWHEHVADFKTSLGHRFKTSNVPIRNEEGAVIGIGVPKQFIIRSNEWKIFYGEENFRYKFVLPSGKDGDQPGVQPGFFGWVPSVHVEEVIEEGVPAPRHTEKPNVGTGHLTPREKAFLDMIAYAEGTGSHYNIIYTFATFKGYHDHPRRIICSYGLCSNAAGRYQFLSSTWDNVARAAGLQDFSPANQDRGALILCHWRGLDPNNISDFESFKHAVWKVNLEWASLPGSPYGQPRKKIEELWKVYQNALK